jgi:hypothetical protein
VDPEGILTTAAEISIAIAGFSGIVVAVAPGHLAELPTAAKSILSTLLLVTASTFTFSFVPLLLLSADISDEVAWVAASLLHTIYLVSAVAYRVNQSRRRAPEDRPGGAFFLFSVLVAGTFVLQIVNALWIQAAWPYLVAMVVMNLSAFLVFSILMWGFVSAA